MFLIGRNRKRINSLSSIGWNMCLTRIPGARDLSRRNTATLDRRLELSRPLRFLAFLRTEVRAPFARSDHAKQVPDGGEGEGTFREDALPTPAERYLFSGSGCRAATTPPRAAAERLAPTATSFAVSLCAAGRGATRRSATSSTTLNRYAERGEEETTRLRNRREGTTCS